MKIFNPSKSIGFYLACALLSGFAGLPAQSADMAAPSAASNATDRNNIESLEHTTLENGKVVLKIGLKQPLQNVPAGFAINNPPRIALDFPDTANALGRNAHEVGESTLRNLNIVQSGTRTRLVLNLAKSAAYETKLDGKYLLVTVQPSEALTATANVTQRFAETREGAPKKHNLKVVDFRRGANGEGRIVVELSDPNTEIDIRTQGKNLVVDFMNTSVPRSLERRLDVVDFATPVQMLETLAQGNNARMTIEPKGLWEYSAYQADNQFIIDVKSVTEDPNKLVQTGKPGYAGEKLSLNFQNVEVRAVLQIIMDFTGLNIVTSDSVTGSLTLRLKDVPWDQALDIILNARGLDKRKNGSVIWVAPRDELALKEKLELESKSQLAELEPLQTEYYQLNYLRADEVKNILTGVVGTAADNQEKVRCETTTGGSGLGNTTVATPAGGAPTGGKQQLISNRGSATYELKKNVLIVNDIPSKHQEIRKILSVIDVPARQVVIESRIVLVDDAFSKALGARLGVQSSSRAGPIGVGVSQNITNSQMLVNTQQYNQVNSANIPGWVGGGYTLSGGSDGSAPTITYTQTPQVAGTGNSNVNLPVGNAAGALAMTLLNLGSGNLVNLELSAMEADNRGKVVSSPRIMTSNQRPAFITQGIELPYMTPGTSTTPPSIAFKSAAICLLVNPQILNNDTIVLDVEVNKDTPGTPVSAGGFSNFSVDRRKIKTQVLLSNGETAVLGGIFEQETHDDIEKVPFLGDIPLVGRLFKKTTKKDIKRELMIFITPKIVNESLSLR